jgi:hypothetical protein
LADRSAISIANSETGQVRRIECGKGYELTPPRPPTLG